MPPIVHRARIVPTLWRSSWSRTGTASGLHPSGAPLRRLAGLPHMMNCRRATIMSVDLYRRVIDQIERRLAGCLGRVSQLPHPCLCRSTLWVRAVDGALSNSHRRPLPRWHDWSGIHHQRRLGQESCRVDCHDGEEQVARQHNRERSRGALHERVE